MANMTDALENTLNDGVSGFSTLLSPTMYLALFTADPTDAGVVTNELTGNGYARTALTGKFPASSAGTVANNVAISSSTATADWLTATHVGYMLGATGGVADMQSHVALTTPVTVLNTGTFDVAIGGLTLTAD